MTELPTSYLADTGAGDAEPSRTLQTRRPLMWNRGTDVGLLILRFAVGGTFVAHGLQIVFGFWGGPGIGGFAVALDGFGYTQTTALAWVAGIGAFAGGALVVLGLLTPLAASGLVALMINTVWLKIGGGFFIDSQAGAGAVELDVVLGMAALALVLTGPGHIALDNGRAWHRRPASWGVLAMIIGIVAGVLVFLLLRR